MTKFENSWGIHMREGLAYTGMWHRNVPPLVIKLDL